MENHLAVVKKIKNNSVSLLLQFFFLNIMIIVLLNLVNLILCNYNLFDIKIIQSVHLSTFKMTQKYNDKDVLNLSNHL